MHNHFSNTTFRIFVLSVNIVTNSHTYNGRTTRIRAAKFPDKIARTLFHPRVNPIIFFDSRLPVGTRTRLDYPSIVPSRAIRVARDVTRDVTNA